MPSRQPSPRAKKVRGVVYSAFMFFSILVGVAGLFIAASRDDFTAAPASQYSDGELVYSSPVLTPSRETHILYGDKTGGGHRHGVGKPCKSEFPIHWGDDKIIDTVKTLAANDNANWQQQDNGYYVAEQNVDNVRVRVVLNEDRTRIITAYPTNLPRNACPARKPANDN
jgi:hypothetical protein